MPIVGQLRGGGVNQLLLCLHNYVGQLRGGGGESVVTVLKQLCFF
jgi:hypothetical protein